MSKKTFKNLFKFYFICSAAFISLNAKESIADAKEVKVSNIEDMKDMLIEARGNASEEEPYIISVEAGSYKLKSAIEMPNNTTLTLDKEAYIECKSAVILIKIRKKNVLHIV